MKPNSTEKPSVQLTALSPAQVQAASLLGSGMRAREVAKKLKFAPETVSRWRQNNANFEALINLIMQETIDATRAGLHDLSGQATRELGKLLKSKSEAMRLRAAALILETESNRYGSRGRLETDPEAISASRENDTTLASLIRQMSRS